MGQVRMVMMDTQKDEIAAEDRAMGCPLDGFPPPMIDVHMLETEKG